jgi:hypothetical protein
VINTGTSGVNFNFAELGLRPQFADSFYNRRAFLATSIITHEYGPPAVMQDFDLQQGDVYISFDGGWQGLRTIQAMYDPTQGFVNLYLYDNNFNLVAKSTPGPLPAELSYNGTLGETYFLRISGTNTDVNLTIIGGTGPAVLPAVSPAASSVSAAGSSSQMAADMALASVASSTQSAAHSTSVSSSANASDSVLSQNINWLSKKSLFA